MWMLVRGELVNLAQAQKIRTKLLANGRVGVAALWENETHVLADFETQAQAATYLEELRPRLNGTKRQ